MNDKQELMTLDKVTETENKEVEFVQAWKITEFTQEVNKQFKARYNVELNHTVNTINNYFRQLEAAGIHYLNRSNGVKIYDTSDLDIALFIANKRNKELHNGVVWQLPQIFEAINTDMPTRKEPTLDGEKVNVGQQFQKQLEDLRDEMFKLAEMEIQIQKEVNELKKENQKQLLLMQRNSNKQINHSMFDILKKEKEFKKEARTEWDKKPSNERFEGFLFKREKISERDEFIEKYVETKMEEWILSQNDDGNTEE